MTPEEQIAMLLTQRERQSPNITPKDSTLPREPGFDWKTNLVDQAVNKVYGDTRYNPAANINKEALRTVAGFSPMGSIADFVEAAQSNSPGMATLAMAGAIPALRGPAKAVASTAKQAERVARYPAANPAMQTVLEPYRMAFPGIYKNPREIAATAAERVVEPDDTMKKLWGVTREDLDEIAKTRGRGDEPKGVILAPRPKGAESARNVMIPENEQRLIDILSEAGKYPGLRHADAWYVLDPVFKRMTQMFGPEEAVRRFRHFNTMTGMASPGSDVLTEVQRGTAAHWLNEQGRFKDFVKYGGTAEDARGRSFPKDMRYIGGHPYHKTSQALPMQQYLERGELRSEAPKVPLYTEASGVPETGYQWAYPVGDAHFSRGVGLADTRKGPSDVAASFSRSEHQTLSPWWSEKVAKPVGIQGVPAQARLWTVLGPQTGVDSPLGQGKLELLSDQIMVAAKRLGVTPQTARDMILSGKAGAGVLAGGVAMGSIADQSRYADQ